MESFENQNIGSEPTQREQILSTARIIEIFKQDNDFEEYASLNSLSKKLEGLSEDQFNLCKRFIEREYNKINISKEQRGDYVDHYYLRHFLSHDILSRFKEEKEKLTLVLQFLLKHENIDLCRQKNFYDNEVKVIKALGEMSENQIGSILALSQESVKNFTNIIKFNPQITESLIQNINTFTDEQIIYLTKIISLSHGDETVSISIFGLLFLNQKINLKIKEIFKSIQPQFLYDVYNEFKETDIERVDESYYDIQLKQIQDDFLNQTLSKEDFIKYLKGNYIKKEIFRAGDLWQGR